MPTADKCGGVLKGTATKLGLAECQCGANRAAELRAHEGGPNHNLMPQRGQLPRAGAILGLARMPVFRGFARNHFGMDASLE